MNFGCSKTDTLEKVCKMSWRMLCVLPSVFKPVLREYWLLIGYSNYMGIMPYIRFVSLAVRQVCLGPVTFFSQPATTWFVARQVGFFGGKMHNITVHLVLQQCYDLGLSFWSNFIWIIFVLRIPLMIRMRGMLNLKMENTQQPVQFTPRHYIWGKQFHCTLRWFF